MATYLTKKNESIKILKKYQEKYKVIHKKTIQSTKSLKCPQFQKKTHPHNNQIHAQFSYMKPFFQKVDFQ